MSERATWSGPHFQFGVPIMLAHFARLWLDLLAFIAGALIAVPFVLLILAPFV